MHLALAIFWVVFAVVVQYYWDVLKDHMFIPVDRTIMGFIFFVLFSYNFIRWRLGRSLEQWEQVPHEPPTRPRVTDPTFDFSDEKKEPPTT